MRAFLEIATPVAACLGGTWLFLRCTGHAARAEMERRQARFHALSEKAFGDVIELHPEAIARGGKGIAGGESGIKAAPAQVRTRHIAHDGGRSTR